MGENNDGDGDKFDIDDDSRDPNDQLGLDEVLDDLEADGDSGFTKEEKEQLKTVTNNFIVDMGVSAKILKKILPKLKDIMIKNKSVTVDYVRFLAEAVTATQEEVAPHLKKIYGTDAKREMMKLETLLGAGFNRDEAMAILLNGFGNGSLGIPSLPFQVARTPKR